MPRLAIVWYQRAGFATGYLALASVEFALTRWVQHHRDRAFSLWYRYAWPSSHYNSPVPGRDSRPYHHFVSGIAIMRLQILMLVAFAAVTVFAV